MRSDEGLLEALIRLWRPVDDTFDPYGQRLTHKWDNIYFLTGLPIHGIHEGSHPTLGGARIVD